MDTAPSTPEQPLQQANKQNKKWIIIFILGLVAIFGLIAAGIKILPKTPPTPSPTPTPTPTSATNTQYISIPGAKDEILDSLPQKIKSGVVYFYKNTNPGQDGRIDSYLKGEVVNIDKKQKNLSVNEATGSGKILIATQDYTVIKSIKLSPPSKPVIQNISFDDLEVGDNISVSNLQYDGQSYIAGTIAKQE